MKFHNYIIVEDDKLKKGLDYYVPKIKKECKPFIDDIRGAAGTLFREDRKNRDKPIWKKITRTDRRPLDSPKFIHDAIDKMFKKKYGWSARSEGLFCWAMRFTDSLTYGNWLVFPAGNYEYVWSPDVDDLWGTLKDFDANDPGAVGSTIDTFKSVYLPKYKNDKIKMAISYGNEVMVRCKYSYLCRLELIEPLNEALDLNWQGAKFKGRKI